MTEHEEGNVLRLSERKTLIKLSNPDAEIILHPKLMSSVIFFSPQDEMLMCLQTIYSTNNFNHFQVISRLVPSRETELANPAGQCLSIK